MEADVTMVLPQLNGNPELNGKKAVVIDALRATSTMVTALQNKATEVIPVMEPAEVVDLVRNIGAEECVSGGERRGLRIDGFDLGNSPREYLEEKIGGKKVILCTTNGTRAVKLAQGAAEVLIGCFLNLGAVVEYLKACDQDTVFVCAGRGSHGLSLEDLVCAGGMIDRLKRAGLDLQLTDAAATALLAFQKAARTGLAGFLRQTDNGRNLIAIGLEEDIDACAAVDSMPLLPRYVNGKVAV